MGQLEEVDVLDLVFERGQPFALTVTLTNESTGAKRTGLTLAEAKVKPSAESATTLLNLNTYLTVDGAASTASLLVPQAIVDALTFTKPAVWDMFCTFDGSREKVCKGSARVVPNVTP